MGWHLLDRRLGDRGWKWLICGLCGLCLLMQAVEFSCGINPLLERRYGSVGMEESFGIDAHRMGTHRLPIERLDPDSELALMGAQLGDQLSFDHHFDRWRKLGLDGRTGPEQLRVTLWHEGQARPLSVTAAPQSFSAVEVFDYLSRFFLAVQAVLFALLIGLKRPDHTAYRALALCFVYLSLSFFFTFNFMPKGPLFSAAKLMQLASFPLIWYCTVRFATMYSPRRANWLQALLRFSMPAYTGVVVCSVASMIWFGLGFEAPWLGPLTLLLLASSMGLTLLSLFGGYQSSGGEMRQRHAWLLASFCIGSIPSALVWTPGTDVRLAGVPLNIVLALCGQGFMYIGLMYAVLKHRVFNFDFAVSRAVVFSAISLLVLLAFSIVKWLTGHWVQAHEQGKSMLVDTAIAMVIIVVLSRVQISMETRIKNLLFSHWHENEQALRRFAKEAEHYTGTEGLLSGLHKALERFTGQSGCVIYLRLAGGGYAQAFNSIPRCAHLLDPDDGLVAALRGRAGAQALAEVNGTEARGAQAFPMSYRGHLNGLVVLGEKRGDTSYRPDELAVLEFVINRVGLDLQALAAAKMERELIRLAKTNEAQREQLAKLEGGHHAPRSS